MEAHRSKSQRHSDLVTLRALSFDELLAEFESSKSVLIGWAEERGDLRPFSLTPEEARFLPPRRGDGDRCGRALRGATGFVEVPARHQKGTSRWGVRSRRLAQAMSLCLQDAEALNCRPRRDKAPAAVTPNSETRVCMLRRRRLALVLGILALVLLAVSWSWIVGVGITVVRVGEVGAILAGLAAVALGLTTPGRARNLGLWFGVVTLVFVFGLNLLGLLFN